MKQVTTDIFWTGALDFDLRVFDIIMHTDFGTTYNSYVVKGTEKTVLFEVVKDRFYEEFLERCDPSQLDMVVISHTEPDHSGALAKLLQLNPHLEVVGTAVAIKFLKNITNMDFKARIVKDKDTIDIGGKTLTFITAPFLHWPDTMYTYIPESKALITCDSFGCHYCDERVFSDLIDWSDDLMASYRYYFDMIMGPFKSSVRSAIKKIEGLEIDVICNGHGPVIRKDAKKYIDLYREWSQPVTKSTPKVVVGYLSSYGFTEKIAMKIMEGLESEVGVEAICFNLLDVAQEDFLEQLADAQGFLLGSPTFLNDALPPIHSLLGQMNPAVHKGLLAGAFGSYGWSGEATDHMEARFKQLKLKTPLPVLKVCFNPSETELEMAYDFGRNFATAIKTA